LITGPPLGEILGTVRTATRGDPQEEGTMEATEVQTVLEAEDQAVAAADHPGFRHLVMTEPMTELDAEDTEIS